MDERIITEREESAIRLCHHDHDGRSIDNAAYVMGITAKEVKALLKSAKHKAPQLFPILTPRQNAILKAYDLNWSRDRVAKFLNITIALVGKEIRFLRKHGFLANKTTVPYVPSEHDSQIKERF